MLSGSSNDNAATIGFRKKKQGQRAGAYRSNINAGATETPAQANTSNETFAQEENSSATATTGLRPNFLSLSQQFQQKSFNPSIQYSSKKGLSIPCPGKEKSATGNQQYVEIYGGPDYAFRKYEDTGRSLYLQKRKESTSFQSAFSAGLRYTRVFSNSMSFRTGLNYSQINEKFTFTDGNIVQLVYMIDANGDTTGSFTSTSTRFKTTYNKFRMLDIPIVIGYEMGNGRLQANINAGVIMNIYSWQKGDVLDNSFQPVNINTSGTNSPYQFKTNIGLGFLGAVSLYYKLNDRFHLLAEPYYRHNFSPVSKSEITFKQKYNLAGLRLGLRLNL
jgi:hypothetical protein